MKTNTLLTYLLYALLAGLIGVAGYKACQMQKEKANLAKESEDEAFKKQMRDMGYLEEDTTGSQYAGDESTSTVQPGGTSTAPANESTATQDGIEDEVPASGAVQPEKSTPPATTAPQKSDIETTKSVSDSGGKPRYYVSAGSFTQLAAARRQMENVIKMGYENAEIGYTNRGKYAVVVVMRTNSLDEANKVLDRLEAKGVDANVVDRNRKN